MKHLLVTCVFACACVSVAYATERSHGADIFWDDYSVPH